MAAAGSSDSEKLLNALLTMIEKLDKNAVYIMFADKDFLMGAIDAGLTPEHLQTVLFAKNVKLFDGINNYVDDFLAKVLPRLRSMSAAEKAKTKPSAILTLNRMKTYAGIDEAHKAQVEAALSEIQSMSGGRRQNRTRRQRRTRRHR